MQRYTTDRTRPGLVALYKRSGSILTTPEPGACLGRQQTKLQNTLSC